MRRLPFTVSMADIALCLLVAATVFVAVTSFVSTDVQRYSLASSDERWGENYLPNVPVVDQHGRAHRFYDDLIKGKNVIVNFGFTSCSQICGLVTSRLVLLQDKLGDAVGRDIFMYTISVDPVNDTPQQLKAYAEAFNVQPGWLFLTGDDADVRKIRDKLGERSTELNDHRQEILLGRAGNWSRDSVMGDLDGLALTVQAMAGDLDYATSRKRAAAHDREMIDIAPGQALFARLCSSCHTIGAGARVGPDLKGVVQRRERAWLANFIAKPDRLRAAGDALALQLAADYPVVAMPDLGLSIKDAEDLISYLDRQSKPPG